MLHIKMYAQSIPLTTHELPELYYFSSVFWVNNIEKKAKKKKAKKRRKKKAKKKSCVLTVFWNVYFGVSRYYVGFTVLWYFCLSYSRSNPNSPSQGEGGNHSNPGLQGTNGIYSWLLPKKSYHQWDNQSLKDTNPILYFLWIKSAVLTLFPYTGRCYMLLEDVIELVLLTLSCSIWFFREFWSNCMQNSIVYVLEYFP